MADIPRIEDPGRQADMLRRAAVACRNARKQVGARLDWFGWVDDYLDQLAERMDPNSPEKP